MTSSSNTKRSLIWVAVIAALIAVPVMFGCSPSGGSSKSNVNNNTHNGRSASLYILRFNRRFRPDDTRCTASGAGRFVTG